jgi:tryptophanyl-tRNA synthetase
MALEDNTAKPPKPEGQKLKRILSGMRPTGKLHLGNYYGALYNWVRLQEHYRCYYFVADWHAITTEYEAPREISGYIPEMLIDWLSAGLDPSMSTLFVQSAVPEHCELYLIFGMFTPVPWLERNPTYKDQMEQLSHKDLATYGFLGYPVLQAADILMYKAEGVPVGVDQVPHVEMTREIARRFNHLYRPIFPEPEALLTEIPKLTGTDGRKMSKSYDNCIYLSDPPEVMAQKVRQMTTDTQRPYRRDPGEPDRCLAFPFHRLNLPKERIAEITAECRAAALGCVDCKKLLAEALLENFVPIQERRRYYEAHPDEVRDILRQGNQRAREQAQKTMAEVRDAIGFNLEFQQWA